MTTFSAVKAIKFLSDDKQAVLLEVKFDHLPDVVEFVARPDDVEAHGRDLFTRAVAGEFGKILSFVPATVTQEDKIAIFKAQTSGLLEATARSLDFDSIAEAMTYCDEPSVPLFQKQAVALRQYRSRVWAAFDSAVSSGKDLDISTLPKFSA